MNHEPNRDEKNTADQGLIDGLTSQQQTLSSFTIGSKKLATTDLVTLLEKRIQSAKAVGSARATWLAAVAADRDLRSESDPVISGVRQALRTMFGSAVDTLAVFGLEPRKVRAPQTPEEKAAAVQKAEATRKARMTLGPKQKAKIKGTVPATAPATPPAAPAPTVTPTLTTAPAAVTAPRS
jgi:hypothetical protein